MTRTYALRRLLEDGPLCRQEILEYMGGKERSVDAAIESLLRSQAIRIVVCRPIGTRRRLYRLWS